MLIAATQASFPQSPQASLYKFYFLDEEHELISISSQDDFDDNKEYIQVAQGQLEDQQAKTTALPSLIYSDSASQALE